MFFRPSRTRSAGEVAERFDVELAKGSPADTVIEAVADLSDSAPNTLVFASGRNRGEAVSALRGGVVLLPSDLVSAAPEGVAVLVHAQPALIFAQIASELYPDAVAPRPILGSSEADEEKPSGRIEEGVVFEAGSRIGTDVQIGRGTIIGANAVIGVGVTIGRNCWIGAGSVIQCSHIGDGVTIHPGSTIGQDGFGYLPSPKGLFKVPQLGAVVIQDRVEIGAQCMIDRGALKDTVIGEGTKIDNGVQIAHNVRIGRHCAIAAQTGISGSVTIGDYVMMGGSCGIADHLTIGDRAQLGARSGLMNDVPAGERWAGSPAMPVRQFFRQQSALQRLAEQGKGRKRDQAGE